MANDPRILTFDALPSAILVWEYDPPLASPDDLRLVAANRAAETIGPRWPMREWIGRARREMQPGIEALNELYLDVARTGETRRLRGLRDDKGTIFDASVFALPSNRLAVSFDNVTEVRHIEEAHRAIFERTHDTILIIDPDTEVVLETNPAAERVYGRDIVGLSMFQLSKNHKPGMSARIISSGFVHFETTHIRADGGEIHLDVHARPIVREGRTVVAGISSDITEQVEARRALQASEEKYRTIVENVPVILWTTDLSGSARFLSGGVERVTGFAFEEVNRTLWLSRIDPADHERLVTAYNALFESNVPFEVEYRFLRKDGRWAWFLDQSGRTYDRDGQRLADGVTQDITERKRGELQQLALAELGRRALGQTEAQALMDDACRTVATVLEVPMTSVLLYEGAENAFFVAATCGVEISPGFRVPNLPDRLAAQTFAGDEPITYDNVSEERRFDTADLVRLNTRAGMCVPISGRERRYGVLHAHTHEPRMFTARETAFLQATANVLAEALHRSGAERELERRQVQLANAQELAHIGSLEVDVDSGRIEWSDEMYRIAGLEPQSREIDVAFVKPLVAVEIRALLSPDHPQLARGEIVEVDHEVYAADGRTRIVHSRVRLLSDRMTGKQKIVATVQDITEKREADAALRDKERRLQLIVARLPVILWSTDAELRINSLTGAGFEPIEERLTNALRFRLPDLISDPPGGPEEGALAALRGQSVSYETTHGTRELRVHIEPLLDESGNAAGTVGIAFDVTEEKRVSRANSTLLEQLHDAAEEWRETFDSIQAPIVITDDDARVCRMNAAALRLSRFEEYVEAVGQPVETLGSDAIWKELDALARASAGHGEAISMQGVDADGRSWDLLASRSARGQTIIIASDVTELVRMQDKLMRTERMSQMGALVAGVAHEVRNPLFGISATLDAFENQYEMEEFREYIAALREQVDRMSQLMHELLEYGRPFASVLQPECIAVVVNGSAANAATLARQHQVTLQSTVPPSLVSVPMDRPRMAQVFDNLIANAIQHSRAGGVVSISAEVTADGSWARIAVEDRGPGFREDDLLRVFEPFFTRRRGGTGLGLSVVHRIVDEHGGSVVATNRDGGGASMIVTLPIARETA
ncbi:MAG TPA: PAS domain S-box protein [Thermoanaerobaculia bacterium]|nr:PAS domain S-box protein [Thermoanaerobaculia bacterium]